MLKVLISIYRFHEQLIKLKTGHASDAVRSYKRPDDC